VGNGRFTFTADITGLQTFDKFHQRGVPLCTQSEWGWHTSPNPKGYKTADVLEDYDVAGHKVPYASGGDFPGGYSPAAAWLRANPHRLHLGRIGFHLTKSNGSPANIEDLTDTSQTLDLWSGLLSSRFGIVKAGLSRSLPSVILSVTCWRFASSRRFYQTPAIVLLAFLTAGKIGGRRELGPSGQPYNPASNHRWFCRFVPDTRCKLLLRSRRLFGWSRDSGQITARI
jgi:hypothetical protein